MMHKNRNAKRRACLSTQYAMTKLELMSQSVMYTIMPACMDAASNAAAAAAIDEADVYHDATDGNEEDRPPAKAGATDGAAAATSEEPQCKELCFKMEAEARALMAQGNTAVVDGPNGERTAVIIADSVRQNFEQTFGAIRNKRQRGVAPYDAPPQKQPQQIEERTAPTPAPAPLEELAPAFVRAPALTLALLQPPQ